MPQRTSAVASPSAETVPTKPHRHLRLVTERGRMATQKASGYDLRAKVEESFGRYKRVVGEALQSDRGSGSGACLTTASVRA